MKTFTYIINDVLVGKLKYSGGSSIDKLSVVGYIKHSTCVVV